jgi:hypothetical protein
LTGLQLPVFAMDFPMDPNPGFRGDSALNSGPRFIEPDLIGSRRKRSAQRGGAERRRAALGAPGTGLRTSLREPRACSMRERARPVKIPVLLQCEATRTCGLAAHRMHECGARRAVHRMALVGLGMSLAPTLRLASTNSGEEWS